MIIPWHQDGDEYTVDASQLPRLFELPREGSVRSLRDFKAIRDRENEATHWELEMGGIKWIVFND